MNPAARRILRMQRQIHKTVRADVRRAIGPRTRELQRYYDAYKREFHGPLNPSNKEELLQECRRAHAILMGDYHTFGQSQKAALRLLRELVEVEPPFTLGLELIPTDRQDALDAYMNGSIDDDEFLTRIDYQKNWGFPWEPFRALLAFARENQIPVLALNHASDRLDVRDSHVAQVAARYLEANPTRRLFVLYGDLHLARGHIPRRLKAELTRLGTKRRLLVVFQNSESLYWKLAEQELAHHVDVVNLGKGRFCIMNAAPWVKLQSFLEWAESSAPLDAEDTAGLDLHGMAHERLKLLAEALNLRLPANLDFTIQTVNDLGFLRNIASQYGLSRPQLKAVKYHVLGNRNVFVPGANLIYLASPSINALNEGVSVLFHSTLSKTQMLFCDPREHFFPLLMSSILAYFGSKVLNHKRKCDLEDDFRLLLNAPLGRDALPAEKMQRRIAKFVLRHCHAQRQYLRDGRYRTPAAVSGPTRVPVFLESARRLGAMLGEKLYVSYVEGRYPSVKIERLFLTELSASSVARKLYLQLVADLVEAPLAHSSKTDLF